MNPFSPNAWVYDPANPQHVFTQLPRELLSTDPVSKQVLQLRLQGGKALGLQICDKLAEGSDHLKVPSWTSKTILTPHEETLAWIHRQRNGVKVRSSAFFEDWISSKAGEQSSRTVVEPQFVLSHAEEVSNRIDPVVLQSLVDGIGLVIDIAYSQILGRVVARVSTGREYTHPFTKKSAFTSPTWDHEGRHEVFDPITAKPLVDRCTGQLFKGSCLGLPVERLVQELWSRINTAGIRFGVQCELIIHPDTPDVWWLVQIRPSPAQVRTNGQTFSALDNPLTTTPAVSRPFHAIDRGSLVLDREHLWLNMAGACSLEDAAEDLGWTFQPSSVLVWGKDPHETFQFMQLSAAFTAGASVQITRRVIAISTSHDRVQNRFEKEQTELMEYAGLMALPDNVHAHVVAQLQTGEHTLEAVSDGFVGQIALL